MSNHVYKTIEITGTSKTGIEDAVTTALKKATESVRNLRWFEVSNIRGNLDGKTISHWQVTMKVGFTLED